MKKIIKIIIIHSLLFFEIHGNVVVRPSSRKYLPDEKNTEFVVVVDKYVQNVPDGYQEQDRITLSRDEHKILEKSFYHKGKTPKEFSWRVHTNVPHKRKWFARKYATEEEYQKLRALIHDILQQRKVA